MLARFRRRNLPGASGRLFFAGCLRVCVSGHRILESKPRCPHPKPATGFASGVGGQSEHGDRQTITRLCEDHPKGEALRVPSTN